VYQTPSAYADVESSAGVSLCVNCFDRVISAESLDATGQAALEELASKNVSLSNMSYAEALEALAGTSAFSAANSPEIQVTVACDNQERRAHMQESTRTCLRDRELTCEEATMKDCETAHEQGKGMHRYGQEHGRGQGNGSAGNGAGNGQGNGGGAGNGNGAGNGADQGNDMNRSANNG